MSIQKPGELRCPTCGYSTPIAAFCTHCGADLPADAPVRPRGMDRDELEERMRGSAPRSRNPFHRGEPAGDPWRGSGPAPERYVAEPSDLLARTEPEDGAAIEARIDRFDDPPQTPVASVLADGAAGADQVPWPEGDREFPPRPLGLGEDRDERIAKQAAAPVYPRARYDADDGGYAGREHAPDEAWARTRDHGGDASDDGFDDDGPPPDDRERRGGTGAIAIIGFVVLGLAALLGGAALSGILNTAAPLGTSSPSPTATASSGASATQGASAEPSAGQSPGASLTPAPSASSGPDNFTAKVQPCASQEMSFPKGCKEDGSTVSSDQVWIYVGFYQAAYNDVIGVTLLDSSGAAVGDGSIQLGQDNIGCKPDRACTGYLYFTFNQLKAGGYTIKVSRDEKDVAQASLTVTA